MAEAWCSCFSHSAQAEFVPNLILFVEVLLWYRNDKIINDHSLYHHDPRMKKEN